MPEAKPNCHAAHSHLPVALSVMLLCALSACGGGTDDKVDAMNGSLAAADSAEARAQALALKTAVADTQALAPAGTISPGGSVGSSATSTLTAACGLAGSEFNSSPSVNTTATYSWACSTTLRRMSSNGIPNHPVGTFPNANNPNRITVQNIVASYTLTPAIVNKVGTAVNIPGYGLNGVKFEPGTAGTCNNAGNSCNLAGNVGIWRIEALYQTAFNFGVDTNNAHVQPNGQYHYHGMPEGLVTKLGGDTAMRLVGWASDGFPVYARKGYTNKLDAASALKTLTPSYRLKATPDANRPATSLYAMGTFAQDWEYVAGLGDLDECNGRTAVTPEFPKGIYHYTVTDTYPFIQRCVKGTPAA